MPSISKKTTLIEFAAIISDAFENAVHTLGRSPMLKAGNYCCV
jgi:hypothetical protein